MPDDKFTQTISAIRAVKHGVKWQVFAFGTFVAIGFVFGIIAFLPRQ